MNRKSRHSSNIGYTRHTKKASKTGKHSTAYKAKMRNHTTEGLYLNMYRLFLFFFDIWILIYPAESSSSSILERSTGLDGRH
jgi:hypothetical protein